MKFFIIAVACAMASTSFAQIKIPDMSPRAHVSQKVGLTNIDINYSRPSARGRSIFSDNGIIPFDQKWRTGANGATSIEIDRDILVAGKALAKGKYAILTTPQRDAWNLHFYKYGSGNWTSYLKEAPIVEVKIPAVKTKEQLESLMIYFDVLTLKSANLNIWWGDTRTTFPIVADSHNMVLSNIEKELSGPSTFDYFLAALYLHETQTDLPRALEYIQKATQDENAQFFQVYREALILKDLGKKTQAIKAAKRSRDLSAAAGNQDLVRLSEQIIQELGK